MFRGTTQHFESGAADAPPVPPAIATLTILKAKSSYLAYKRVTGANKYW